MGFSDYIGGDNFGSVVNEVGDVDVIGVTGIGSYGSLSWEGWPVWCPVICNLTMYCGSLMNLGFCCDAA